MPKKHVIFIEKL